MENKKAAHLGKTYSIFLVEDHPIFRKGLVQLINSENDMEVCGEAEDYLDGLNGIKKMKPDFAIVDISLKSSSGIELVKDIKLHFSDMPVLVLSMHDENIYAERVLKSGARGYLMKEEAPETVITAIRHILSGKIFVSDDISARMLNRMVDGNSYSDTVDALSDRELEVFKLIGDGKSTRDIASMLNISVKTVENHRAHIKEKLNLSNSIELIQQATLWVKKSMK